MIKGILFDMDGLMVDTEKLLSRFWCESARSFGYPMTPEHVLGIRSLAAKYSEPHLKGIFGEDFDYKAVRAKRIELMNAFIAENGIEKKKGLDELLEYIAASGLKCAVCTATDRERTARYLKSRDTQARHPLHGIHRTCRVPEGAHRRTSRRIPRGAEAGS